MARLAKHKSIEAQIADLLAISRDPTRTPRDRRLAAQLIPRILKGTHLDQVNLSEMVACYELNVFLQEMETIAKNGGYDPHEQSAFDF